MLKREKGIYDFFSSKFLGRGIMMVLEKKAQEATLFLCFIEFSSASLLKMLYGVYSYIIPLYHPPYMFI
jgi:hypothetical protein